MKFVIPGATALVLAAPVAFAQTAEPGDMTMTDGTEWGADLIRTRDITGGTSYTTNEADDEGWAAAFMHDTINSDRNQIGTIKHIVLSRDGQMVGIVAEVGGFLDLGDKHVMIPVTDLNLVAIDDVSCTFVTRYNEEDLESMEGVDEGFWN